MLQSLWNMYNVVVAVFYDDDDDVLDDVLRTF